MSSGMKSNILVAGLLALLISTGLFRIIPGMLGTADVSSVNSQKKNDSTVSDKVTEKNNPDQQTETGSGINSMPPLLIKEIPESLKPVIKEKPFLHWELHNDNGELKGIAVQTVSIAPNAGSSCSYSRKPVNLGIIFSSDGSIRSCVLLSSHDNEEFLFMIRNRKFLDRLKRKSLKELKGVDAVSGATFTCSSILEAARTAAAVIELYLEELKEGSFSVSPQKTSVPNPLAETPRLKPLAAEKIRGITEKTVKEKNLSLKEARFYTKLENNNVQCGLCPFSCILSPGERGQCRVRANIKGSLRTLVYGRVLAYHVDPIEKKPLYHFLPSSKAYSVATAGCNLRCIFCQNYTLSQAYPEDIRGIYKKSSQYNPAFDSGLVLSPEETVELARKNGCRTIAYTYSEPSVFYEYMLDTAQAAKKKGIYNVWVTCGNINTEPLKELCRFIDGANVDLKGFSEEYYRKYCNAHLSTVLDTLKTLKKEGVYFEITNLIVPGGNDDPDMIRNMCKWITANLGRDIPLHFSRFYPQYKMSGAQPTPAVTLTNAARIAKDEGIQYVYLGNLRTGEGEDTFCPKCGKKIIDRWGYYIKDIVVKDGKCSHCGHEINGIWK